MSEGVTISPDPTQIANDAAFTPMPPPAPGVGAVPPPAPSVGAVEHGIASTPMLALPLALPPETHALVDLIGRGLAPEADESTRAAARDLWSRFAQSIATAAQPMPAAPVTLPAPMPLPAPVMPPAPATLPLAAMPAVPLPTSPIAMAARALRQLPPDQLLDLALQRLRAALPAGTTVPTPKGIQFQLVPVLPPPGVR